MAKRILVIDDETDVLDAFARALSIAGYSVEKAGTTQAALELCRDHVFDLVVVDFIMPGMSGLQLLNKIRAIHPTIRSIVISGKVDPNLTEDEVATRLKVELEADEYFSKPVRNERLIEAIERLLTAGKDQQWTDVAERVLNSQKSKDRVRRTEKGLKAKNAAKKK